MGILKKIKNLFWSNQEPTPTSKNRVYPSLGKHKRRQKPSASRRKKELIKQKKIATEKIINDNEERWNEYVDERRYSKFLEILALKNPKLKLEEIEKAGWAEWRALSSDEKVRYDRGGMYWDLNKIIVISEIDLKKKVKRKKKKGVNKKGAKGKKKCGKTPKRNARKK